eukprot:502622-Rhodomonas_salina.2
MLLPALYGPDRQDPGSSLRIAPYWHRAMVIALASSALRPVLPRYRPMRLLCDVRYWPKGHVCCCYQDQMLRRLQAAHDSQRSAQPAAGAEEIEVLLVTPGGNVASPPGHVTGHVTSMPGHVGPGPAPSAPTWAGEGGREGELQRGV